MGCGEIFKKSLIFVFFCAFIALLITPLQNLRNPQIGTASYARFDGHLPSITACPYSRKKDYEENISTFSQLKDLPSLRENVNVTIYDYYQELFYNVEDSAKMEEIFGLSPEDEIIKEPIISRFESISKCLSIHVPPLPENWLVCNSGILIIFDVSFFIFARSSLLYQN